MANTLNIYKQNEREIKLYLNEISKNPLLTLAEEKALGRRIQEGDSTAVSELVIANLRFVVKVARRYRGRGLSLLDLINEGNIGMINAAMRFDPTKNAKFITYAVWWIRDSIVNALSRLGRPVRFPPIIFHTLYKMDLVVRKKQFDLSRNPTIEEVADETGLEIRKLRGILRLSEYIYSNQISDDSNEIESANVYRSSCNADPFSIIFRKQLHRVLGKLSIQEEKVLRLRYGIERNEMTLQEIGDLLSLSRERIRQIQLRALTKCKKILQAQKVVRTN